jgi:coatomer protein complex subunit epsilon
MDCDALRQLRNYYYVGQYAEAIAEAVQVKQHADASVAPLADLFHFRALLGQGDHAGVNNGITANATAGLQAVKLQCTFRTASAETRDMVFDTIGNWLGDASLGADEALRLVCAHIYLEAGKLKEALQLVHDGHSFEAMNVAVQIYLRIDRVDLAAKTVATMQEMDDNDTMTQLATSWLGVVQGGEKATEAFFLLQELVEKFGATPSVLNGMAAAQMALHKYADAFGHLRQAREIDLAAKRPVAADTLINSMVCLQHLQKSGDIINTIEAELKTSHPNHPFLQRQADVVAEFDRAAANYSL